MRKIPTLFKRDFDEWGNMIGATDELRLILPSDAIPTVKWDGACCAFIGGKFFRSYDAKPGKVPPTGAIPCQAHPDPVTLHWPHWLPVDKGNKADKWFLAALENYHEAVGEWPFVGTFEAIGPHFQGNPYGLERDILVKHGLAELFDLKDFSFDAIKQYLTRHEIEGIVFWSADKTEPLAKIKRTDFGLEWPVNRTPKPNREARRHEKK